MTHILWLFLALLMLGAAPIESSAQGASRFDTCRSGQVRGGGYDPVTQKYEFTCANYNWSAEVGGIDSNGVSKYGSPTTPGGNSWTLNCTGDGVGNSADGGTALAEEQAVCLFAGEKIKMYSMADIQLALENAKPHGGKAYLPSGLYHDAYCGRQPEGTANGCPVLREDPTFQVRKWTVWGGRALVGEGPDRNGPLSGGRTGTYLISDHGSDSASNGFQDDWSGGSTAFKTISCGSAGVSCGYVGGHWAWQVGRKNDVSYCAWPSGAAGCDTDTATVIAGSDRLARTVIGRGAETTSIIADFFPGSGDSSNPMTVCVNNAIATSGVCSGNLKVQCTNDSETRASDTTGGCPDSAGLGSCVGYADAIELAMTADPNPYLVAGIKSYAKTKYAGLSTTTEQSTAVSTDTQKMFYALISSVGSTCNSTGRSVNFANPSSTALQYSIGEFPHYDSASQPNGFYVMDLDDVDNHGGGVFDLSVLPAQWWTRTGGTASATCNTGETSASCDELEKMNLSGDWWGEWSNIASWYGGSGISAGYGFSEQDGDPANLWGSVNKSLFASGRGLLADGSGWDFVDNTVISWAAPAVAMIKLNFSPGARTKGLRVMNSIGNHLFSTQESGHQIIEDLELIGNEFNLGALTTRGGWNFSIKDVRGWGNFGPVITISGDNGDPDVWDVSIRDVHLSNHRIGGTGTAAAIMFTDFNGAFPAGKWGGFIDIQNVAVEYFAGQNSTLDEICGVLFDGGLGTDAAAASGQSRTIDDYRNVLGLKNIDISYVTDSVAVAGAAHFCFANQVSGSAAPTVAASTNPWSGVRGPLPSWENFKLQNVPYPDNLSRSITAAQAGNCGTAVPAGTQVLVHNLDGVDCSETAGILDADASDATNEIGFCRCSTAGTWAAPP